MTLSIAVKKMLHSQQHKCHAGCHNLRRYAECHHTECRYAECQRANNSFSSPSMKELDDLLIGAMHCPRTDNEKKS